MKFRSFIRYTWLSLHLTQEELLSMRAWRWYDRVWRLRAAVTNYACSFGSSLKTMHLLQSRKLRFWLPRSCIYFDVLPLLWLEINRSHHLPMTELHMAGASIYTGTIPCSRWNNTIGFIQLDWNHSFAHVWRTVLYIERESFRNWLWSNECMHWLWNYTSSTWVFNIFDTTQKCIFCSNLPGKCSILS